MMKYKVIISVEADRQLVDCLLFLSDVSIEATDKLQNIILTSIKTLEDMPQRHPFFNEPNIIHNKYRKMVIQRRYMVLYQITDSIVYVDYVLDCRRDYQWLIE